MQVVLEVAAFTLDPRDGRGVVVLAHRASERPFPIWLADHDAAAVARALSGVPLARPDSQELVWEIVATVGAGVEHVEIVSVVGGVVNARIALLWGDERRTLDARPSDALVLALRSGAPILVDDELLQQVAARVRAAEARVSPVSHADDESPLLSVGERWNQLLAHLPRGPHGPLFEA